MSAPDPCPFGSGAHPYLTVGTPTVDSVLLHVPAGSMLRGGRATAFPPARVAVDGTEYDFRAPRPIGATRLDTRASPASSGTRTASRGSSCGVPSDGGGVALWVDESYRYLMLYTGDDRPDVQRRSLAVEPMTCPPNAFNSARRPDRSRARRRVSRRVGDRPALRRARCCSFGSTANRRRWPQSSRGSTPCPACATERRPRPAATALRR